MKRLLESLLARMAQGEDAALVTLTAAEGSAPRKAGAQMLVSAAGRVCGTVGGGAAERAAEQAALRCIASRRSVTQTYALHPAAEGDLGMVCGGSITALVQFVPADSAPWRLAVQAALGRIDRREKGRIFLAPDCVPVVAGEKSQAPAGAFSLPVDIGTRALIFGAGHIARALVPLLRSVDFRPVVMDDRAEFAAAADFPAAEQVLCGDFSDISRTVAVEPSDFAVVLTSGHRGDGAVMEQLLRGEIAYLGVIGSKAKKAAVNERLLEKGISQARLDFVHTPVGLSIGAVTPEEIAVSIAAEMIRIRAEQRKKEA